MNIYEKMLKITDEIDVVSKNLEVGFGNNKYKAVGEADVLNAVKPIEVKNGVYSYPLERQIIQDDVMVNEKINAKGEVSQTHSKFIRIKVIYRFVNIEKPSEFVDITSYGDGVDTMDKAPGKAMTYADKYALLKAYKIQTGDDPDKDPGENGKFKSAKEKIKPNDIKILKELMAKKGADEVKFLAAYGISSIEELNNEQLAHALKLLWKKEDVVKI